MSLRMNKCLEKVIDRHFWNPGVFSYAMMPRCRPNSRVFYFIITFYSLWVRSPRHVICSVNAMPSSTTVTATWNHHQSITQNCHMEESIPSSWICKVIYWLYTGAVVETRRVSSKVFMKEGMEMYGLALKVAHNLLEKKSYIQIKSPSFTPRVVGVIYIL